MEINSQRAIYQRLFQPTLLVIPHQLADDQLDPIPLHNILQVLHGKPKSVVGDPVLEFKGRRAELVRMSGSHLTWA